MPKTEPLCTSTKLNLRDRVLGKVEKNSFIALPGKGDHSRLLPWITMNSHPGWFDGEFYSKGGVADLGVCRASVQLLSPVQIFPNPWTAACYASCPSPTPGACSNSSNQLIICCPLLLLPKIFPSIRVFSKESVPHIRWPKYWSFSINPSNEYSSSDFL